MLAAIETWDIDALSECGRRYADAARSHGALRMLQIASHANATAEVFRGDLATAQLHFAEFKDVADATGADSRLSHPTDAMLHGWRGDEAATLAAVRAQLELYPERPGGVPVQLVRAADVVLRLGQGRYAEAQAAAGPVLDEPPPHGGGLVLPGLVEAAVRNHDTGTAQRALDRLTERAEACRTPWALGLLARSRAVMAVGAEADALFRDAAAHLDPTPLGTEKAHTHLLHGEWLRRRRRVVRPGSTCAPPMKPSPGWGRPRSRNGPAWSCGPRVNTPGGGVLPHPRTSRPRRHGSRGWPPTGPPTRRSPPISSSARAPLSTTSPRSSGSLGSPPAEA